MAILIVEDNPNGRRLLKLFRQRCGHRVEVAGDGAETLGAIARKQPDLVVTDLKCPTSTATN